jgi:hypothetical protein
VNPEPVPALLTKKPPLTPWAGHWLSFLYRSAHVVPTKAENFVDIDQHWYGMRTIRMSKRLATSRSGRVIGNGRVLSLRQVLEVWQSTQQSYADAAVVDVNVVNPLLTLLKALLIISPLLSTGPILFSPEHAA